MSKIWIPIGACVALVFCAVPHVQAGLPLMSAPYSAMYVAGDFVYAANNNGVPMGYGGFFVPPNPSGKNSTVTITVNDASTTDGRVWAMAQVGSGVTSSSAGVVDPSSATCFFGTLSNYPVPATINDPNAGPQPAGVYVYVFDALGGSYNNTYATSSTCPAYATGSGTVGQGLATYSS
ncbi:MAG: hypothetical protein ACYDDF_05085 [Thermoplasmatota archaeon]